MLLQVCYGIDDSVSELLLPLNFVHFGEEAPAYCMKELPKRWQPPGDAAARIAAAKAAKRRIIDRLDKSRL